MLIHIGQNDFINLDNPGNRNDFPMQNAPERQYRGTIQGGTNTAGTAKSSYIILILILLMIVVTTTYLFSRFEKRY